MFKHKTTFMAFNFFPLFFCQKKKLMSRLRIFVYLQNEKFFPLMKVVMHRLLNTCHKYYSCLSQICWKWARHCKFRTTFCIFQSKIVFSSVNFLSILNWYGFVLFLSLLTRNSLIGIYNKKKRNEIQSTKTERGSKKWKNLKVD